MTDSTASLRRLRVHVNHITMNAVLDAAGRCCPCCLEGSSKVARTVLSSAAREKGKSQEATVASNAVATKVENHAFDLINGRSAPPMVLLQLSADVKVMAFSEAVCTFDGDGTASGFGGDSTGTRPWWGGLLLGAWIASLPADAFAGKDVLELGCGAAPLPSAAAALRGAEGRVLATDGCPTAVRSARSLFGRNHEAVQSCDSQRLAWEDVCSDGWSGRKFDVVLFADVLYTTDAAELLSRVLRPLLRPGGEVIGAVGLHRIGAAEIFREMRRQGFHTQAIEVPGSTMAAAEQASARLQNANAHDLQGNRGPIEARCKLVRWRHTADFTTAQLGADVSEELRTQAVDALYEMDSKTQMAPGFEVWE
eukprot:TRINITY_DN75175_c0_g1_i1.p1 TRINITY_DN75175_c0_g1~~TRINITY_DN75175_c0_g1_i1.p1  ORF type:complete len:366 (+),score=77.81 TRINITY_DN75175_c0_g1_i1:43-1140(+)